MSWFKKIFQNNTSKSKEIIEDSKEIKKELIPEYNSTTSAKSYFSGLDNDFINLIYFNNETEKTIFISEIEKLLNKLKINVQTDLEDGRKKIADYRYDAEEIIPFLNEIILYNSDTTSVPKEMKNETADKSVNTKLKTHNKLDNYYTALDLCFHNLEKKTENNFFDFEFENELVYKTIEKSDLYNFARISTLFMLGASFYKANQIENMENAFSKIRIENYELSPSTVADYYRNIGEIYIELKQNDRGLEWLKKGLALNPKLGVKKLVDKLEKELNEMSH